MILGCGSSTVVNKNGNEKDNEKVSDKTWTRFALISDLNGSYGSKNYHASVSQAVKYLVQTKHQIQFVLSTGDMVAGQRSNLDYEGMWSAFNQRVTKPLHQKNIPLFPSPGNHDAYRTRKIERAHYQKTWLQSDPFAKAPFAYFVKGVTQSFPFQYAFRVKKALFISLDNTDVRPWENRTVQWMEQVLEKEKDATVKFVFGHVPLLPFAFKKEREYVARGSVDFLDRIEDLFEKYKVDAFFSGHSHVYYPGRREGHTEFISVPLLGGGTRYLITQDDQPRSQRGFLVVDYNDKGDWVLEHRLASNYKIIEDDRFPEAIQLPSVNTKLCSGCTQFPETHFLDREKRIIYKRKDL